MKKDLKGELSGNFEAVVVRMFYDNDEFDAWCLRRAMKGAGTDECALIEILCTRSNADIKRIKAAYKEEYGRDLEADINSETSGHFKRVLISSCQGNRQEVRTYKKGGKKGGGGGQHHVVFISRAKYVCFGCVVFSGAPQVCIF
jgi:hypothetical protein